ncbi:hypothetical protein LZ012_16945 [Dechloromonas sp. XY25]|uniref:Uncharacterized protein n=1 Tax=Dechloromonas hankyongensis TaxID=2908002 RepID=A0ABS9K691_9RHOO|nr:hypothetical protein [Dechloromonas hankyongensis]MCG2578688.1 hypothetical protein [Dechloromonas hankyongensis]
MKILFLIFALLSCGWAAAETEDNRLDQLEAAYNRVQQEQQAVFQQFQMTQELRRNELEPPPPPGTGTRRYSALGDDSRALDYDENVRLQQARQDRLQRYDKEISRAYTRYLELANQKKALLDQMQTLGQPEPEARR